MPLISDSIAMIKFFQIMKFKFHVAFIITFLLFSVQILKAQESDPIAIFNLGQDAHEKGDYKKAIELYEEALRLLPDFPEAEYQRAAALIELGKLDDAETGLRKVLELRPDWSLPMVTLASVLVSKRSYAEAEDLIAKALKIDDSNNLAYILLAEIRLQDSNASLESLKNIYEKIRAISQKASSNASIWALRAALERRLGDKDSAKSSIQRALSFNPKHFSALSERIEIALLEGDFTSAVTDAENLVRMYPNYIDGSILLARSLAADGDTSGALRILEKLDPLHPEVKRAKRLIELQGSTDVASLEKQLENEKDNLEIISKLCLLTRRSDPSKSVEYCRRYFEKQPELAATSYASALVQAKEYEKAIDILQKVIIKTPENYTAHANLAIALFQMKKYREARKEYEWLAEKNPQSPVIYYFLGVIDDSLGDYVKAIISYETFLRLADPQKHKLEIESVKFRLPVLKKKIEGK